jgi:DNA-binding response OmpR family regulator
MDATAAQALRPPVRVLLASDQRLLAEMVELTLNHSVCVTRTAKDVSGAAEILAEWSPHLVVLDMDVGGGVSVQQFIGSVTGKGTRIPVLALTRRGDLKTKLAAFEWGVDDIMTIPLSPGELLARTLAITRRTYSESLPLNPVLKLGELELDILNRRVRVGDSEMHLTALEQSLLYLLAANSGRVITRDEILDTLWGVDFVADSNLVDRHVRALRAKLMNDHKRPRFISTVPGRGYCFLPTS